jgi:hypothetical protein
MLTHPLLQGRSRGNDAVHEDSGVADGQSDCRCGLWISDSWAGAGKWAGVVDHPGAEGYKYAYHFLPFPVPMALSPVLYFLLSSVVLGSIWQAMGATILGVGHITVTMREYRRVAAKETVQAQQKDDQVAVRQP